MVEDCLFCKIIKGEVPSYKIYEDEDVIAFLDIFPFNNGHTVVVPAEHYTNFLDFSTEKMGKYFGVLQKVAIQLKEKLHADGINIVQNNFHAAGQAIFHMHFHLIPRWQDDKKISLKQPKQQATKEHLQELLKQITA